MPSRRLRRQPSAPIDEGYTTTHFFWTTLKFAIVVVIVYSILK